MSGAATTKGAGFAKQNPGRIPSRKSASLLVRRRRKVSSLANTRESFALAPDTGRTDLEGKAPLATEGVQWYGESSANGGRTKTLIKTKKTEGFQP